MNKLGLTLLIGFALLMVVIVPLAILAFVFLPIVMEQLDTTPQPKGEVLVYEFDPDGVRDGATVDVRRWTELIDGRLNSKGKSLARVRQLGARQIEVAMFRQDDAETQRVKQLLSRAGTLEFRILAHNRDNKELIERALANPSETQIRDNSGLLQAWWVPVKAGEEKSFEYREIVRRTRKVADREVTDVLVLKDPYDITGAYLIEARAGSDRSGKPCLEFKFNSIGGQLFGELTGSHLPDTVTNFTYKLGIILDGELYSAPVIQSTITNRGEISGKFTEREVEDLVCVLNSGSLPGRLRLVETKPAP